MQGAGNDQCHLHNERLDDYYVYAEDIVILIIMWTEDYTECDRYIIVRNNSYPLSEVHQRTTEQITLVRRDVKKKKIKLSRL